ncbi:putative ribonucelotide-diphosphate reductase alpha subunit NrdE [Bacillus phage vB_BspM_Internexus]|nr:putative ribonucelotide-diphosphate reductase alpha subunit NrdE [Bacillus phage vB_BspM_Internexus]
MKDYLKYNNSITKKGDNGFWQLENDKLAISSFAEEIDEYSIKFPNLLERLNWLIGNNYYYNVFQDYSLSQIEEVYNAIKKVPFSFQSFMAISKFYSTYALKTTDKKYYLETYQDRIAIVALYLFDGNLDKAIQAAIAMIEQRVQPATPTFLNAGKARRGELVSCFLDEMDDTLNSISHIEGQSKQLSKIGGGVSTNVSKLRMLGDPVNGEENAAKGVIPVMKLLEQSFSYADQMGQRKGSGAVYLNIFHGDIIHFLNTKKINADDSIRMKTLSTGIIVPDKFIQLLESGEEEFYTFSPYSVEKEYGIPLDEMDLDVMYDELVNNPNIKKFVCELSPMKLMNQIAMTQLESGYPYLFFKTNANKEHALKAIGEIKFSNLCTEIMQLSSVSVINDYGEEDELGLGISCNLASLNIVNVMETKKFKDSVDIAMDILTSVTDKSDIKNAPSIRKANALFHSVGLGAMNLHGFLAKNSISYESAVARDFANVFFAIMNFHSIRRSMEIAIEKNKKFHRFEDSEYANGNYFKRYIENDYTPRSQKVKELFEGIFVPTKEDWTELAEQVKENGLYHAYRLAIAPTQSISYVQNSTQSIMPVVSRIENRTYHDSTTYYPMPYLDGRTQWSYKSAYDMDQNKIIDMVAVIQQHIDQGISTTLFVNSDIPTDQLVGHMYYANKRGLKSLYYVRNRSKSGDDICESCAV